MLKPELVKRVKEALNLSSLDAASDTLDKLSELIAEIVNSGEQVTLKGLGKFTPVVKEAHTCRNPMTGETINVPKKQIVRFKPASNLKKVINE